MKRFLRAGKIKWYENVVLKEEIHVELPDSWSKIKDKEFLDSIIQFQ